MKKIIIYSSLFFIAMFFTTSCKKSFLTETPLTFYTPSNSFKTPTQFQAAVNNLASRVRDIDFGNMDLDSYFALRYATDFAVNATDYNPPAKLNDYKNTMIPTFGPVQSMWTQLYNLIANANLVIAYAPKATTLTAAQQTSFAAQALFFRAWSYNMLANLYGGVPLQLVPLTAPKVDFVRATRAQVYTQCAADLTQAIAGLDNIDKVVDGAVNKQAAQHVLTEVYISLQQYDQAIAMATNVINYPGVGLMTQRFGSHMNSPGDAYRDLFELHNQNYSAGNREGLYVVQTTYNNSASVRDFNGWAILPQLAALNIQATVNGKTVLSPVLLGGQNDKICGNAVGWMRPTNYFLYQIWGPGDIRNSQYNIVRDIQIDGVPSSSPDYGKFYVKDGYMAKVKQQIDTIRNFFPILRKTTPGEGDFPAPDYTGAVSPLGGAILNGSSQNVFRDYYLIRLAETYLLRAEAYVRNNNNGAAAVDINVLRARAHASTVTAAQMNIDFILDERLRELYAEEFRMVTLTRMGLLYDRTKKYNEKSGLTIQTYHNLWPIPFNEIQHNTGAEITQNPGY